MPTIQHGDATIHSEEVAALLPNGELVPEWKTEPALSAAKARVLDVLVKHTPTR